MDRASLDAFDENIALRRPSPMPLRSRTPSSTNTPQLESRRGGHRHGTAQSGLDENMALGLDSNNVYLDLDEDSLLLPDPSPSGRTSISSFPASVVHHDISRLERDSCLPFMSSRSPSTRKHSYIHDHCDPSSAFDEPEMSTLRLTSSRSSRTQSSRSPYTTGFRNPSSVVAMQMRDEFSDLEDAPLPSPSATSYMGMEETTPNRYKHRRHLSRPSYNASYRTSIGSSVSNRSPSPTKRLIGTPRSSHSSPIKRASSRNSNRHQTPVKKEEFPLVLLHCTLLPPVLSGSNRAHLVPEHLLEALIPEPYNKRWRMVHNKITRNQEVTLRGVLIPHPRDEYEMLEERLLESLELKRPRIRRGHYVGDSDGRASVTDSGFESGENGTDDERQQPWPNIERDGTVEGVESVCKECPDCGHKVAFVDEEEVKKWEIKVYAANGLMRAGAWSAAWQEMEKVDVEVGVWMPEDVRREVEARIEVFLSQDQQSAEDSWEDEDDTKSSSKIVDERTREIYGEAGRSSRQVSRKQEEIDGLVNGHQLVLRTASSNRPQSPLQPQGKSEGQYEHAPPESSAPPHTFDGQSTSQKPELQDILLNYVRLLLQDRRNIAIILLSILVVLYAMANADMQKSLPSSSKSPATTVATTMVSDSAHSSTSTTTRLSSEVEYLTTTVVSTSTSVSTTISTTVSVETHVVIESSVNVDTKTVPSAESTSVPFENDHQVPYLSEPSTQQIDLLEHEQNNSEDERITEDSSYEFDTGVVQSYYCNNPAASLSAMVTQNVCPAFQFDDNNNEDEDKNGIKDGKWNWIKHILP